MFINFHFNIQEQFYAPMFPYMPLEDQIPSDTYMITNGMHDCPRQHFECSSPERLLLALHAEHVQLLLLLLTQRLAVPHLGEMNKGNRVMTCVKHMRM